MPITTTILAIAVAILVGYIIKSINLLCESEWRGLERIAYYVLLPCLLYEALANTSVNFRSSGLLVLSLIATSIILTLLLIILSKRLSWEGPVFSSIFQGALRWNGYFALAIGESIKHTDIYGIIIMTVAVYVPMINIASIAVLKATSKSTDNLGTSISFEILLNPIVVACFLGIISNLLGITLPSPVNVFISSAGDAAIPIGLIAIGASLQFRYLLSNVAVFSIPTVLKNLAFPLTAYMIAFLLELPETYCVAILICTAAPTAPSSFILARQLGGDHVVMSGIVTFSTLMSLITTPILFQYLWNP